MKIKMNNWIFTSQSFLCKLAPKNKRDYICLLHLNQIINNVLKYIATLC